MKKIIIYTDGSYSNGHGGYSFLIHFIDSEFKQILGYGRIIAKTPSFVELFAIKMALEYIVYKGYNLLYKIEIKSDAESIVNLLNKRLSCEHLNTYDEFINKEKNTVNETVALLKLIPKENFSLTHVKRKRNTYNNIVDIWAGYARKSVRFDTNSMYILYRESEATLYKQLEIIQNGIEIDTAIQ